MNTSKHEPSLRYGTIRFYDEAADLPSVQPIYVRDALTQATTLLRIDFCTELPWRYSGENYIALDLLI